MLTTAMLNSSLCIDLDKSKLRVTTWLALYVAYMSIKVPPVQVCVFPAVAVSHRRHQIREERQDV